jgi:TolA-binding protein
VLADGEVLARCNMTPTLTLTQLKERIRKLRMRIQRLRMAESNPPTRQFHEAQRRVTAAFKQTPSN